jgi:hypothetical protein
MVEGLKVTTDKKAAAEQIKGLYKLFVEKDCTMVEVSRQPRRHRCSARTPLLFMHMRCGRKRSAVLSRLFFCTHHWRCACDHVEAALRSRPALL